MSWKNPNLVQSLTEMLQLVSFQWIRTVSMNEGVVLDELQSCHTVTTIFNAKVLEKTRLIPLP
jgi:hypothetical protein